MIGTRIVSAARPLLALAAFVLFASLPLAAQGQVGMAVHYSDKFQGKPTANKDIFDQEGMTAAHKKFPYGTMVKVTNLANGNSVVVRINDRMRRANRNIIDVTRRAARELGFEREGRARVRVEKAE